MHLKLQAEELGGVVEAVHVPGIGHVLLPVGNGALAGLQRLQHTRHTSVLLAARQHGLGTILHQNSRHIAPGKFPRCPGIPLHAITLWHRVRKPDAAQTTANVDSAHAWRGQTCTK